MSFGRASVRAVQVSVVDFFVVRGSKMEKFSNGILKTLAAVGVILFVLTLGVALVFFNAEKRLFNAQLYLDALESQNFYERLPALAAESIAAAPASEDPNSPRTHLSMLPAENWETVFRALLPADVSRPMTRQAITSVFDYLNGKNESASLSLVDFKAHLTGPAGTEALLAILRAQPPCTFDQITQLTLGSLFGQSTEFILCNPSDELLSLFQPILQGQLQAIASTLPDSVDLTPNATTSAKHPLDGLRGCAPSCASVRSSRWGYCSSSPSWRCALCRIGCGGGESPPGWRRDWDHSCRGH